MQGEELGPLFVPPQDPHYLWILIVAFSAATIAVALIALVRGRMPAVIPPALVLLPIFTYVLGDLQLLEQSKEVEFCGSCHETMSPVVHAMQTGEDTLSAIHYSRGAVSHQSACYECHSGYGIWGGVNAKVAGVRHMLHTVTGDYDFPIELAGPFDFNSCLGCHSQARTFRAVETHQDPDIQRALVEGEMTCTGLCHPEAHPAEALQGAEGTQAAGIHRGPRPLQAVEVRRSGRESAGPGEGDAS